MALVPPSSRSVNPANKIIVPPSGDTSGAADPLNIQAAINALRGIGGCVQVDGHFYTASTITLYPGIGLVSSAPLSQGTQGTNLLTAVSSLNAPIVQVIVDPSNLTWVSFPYLANLAISGTHGQTSQDGVFVTDANGAVFDLFLDHVLIFDTGGNAINHANAGKTWVTECYAERAQANGIRSSKGTLHVESSYVQNNVLAGIDATSSGFLRVIGTNVWQNAQRGIILWSMTSGAIVTANAISDNGDNTHSAVLLRSLSPTILGKVRVADNYFTDARAAGAVAQYYIDCVPDSSGVAGSITDNNFDGNQKAGNDAIHVAANANNHLLITDNYGFNDAKGQIANPLDTTNNRIGLAGTTSTPVASTDYLVSECSQYVVVTGGTGVSITVKDPNGVTVQSGLTTFAGILPNRYRINFGAFSVAPTLTSFVT